MRGEYFVIFEDAEYLLGSPPHARGIPGSDTEKSSFPGITPACAGNTENPRS